MAQLNPVTPLYSPSVTATNGSDIIAVTGNVDCSFVRSGTTVFITGRQPVRAISGTVPDGSGNSTIKLKVAWPYATTTGELLAINTYEGLADAIYQLGELVDAAEANQNKVFEYKGSYDLAAAGALPAAPANGSAMYRISTQATIASRLYRVGEPIYYDNLTSQWRSMWEAMGTAAYRNAMSSINDMTTPNALMERGAFGLGATSAVSPPTINNIDALDIPGGLFRVTTSITGGTKPFGYGDFTYINARYNSVDAMELAGTTDNNLFFRHSAAGTKPNWKKILAYAAGGVGTATTNLNNHTETGFFEISNGVHTNVPAAGSGTLIHITRGSTSPSIRAVQIICINGVLYQRQNQAGAWGVWRTSYTASNIVGTVSQSVGVPTGAIIERGSNANGHYDRFANGTQICWQNFASAGAAIDWIFPAAFAAGQLIVPVGTACSGTSLAHIVAFDQNQLSNTALKVSLLNDQGAQVGSGGFFRVAAFGRWYA